MRSIHQIFFYCSLLFTLLLHVESSSLAIQPVIWEYLPLEDCLMPPDHPLQKKLNKLFNNPKLFQSPQQMKQAGFEIINNLHRGLMVASHPSIKNYLIKKFQDHIPQDKQLNNYLKRINGARALNHFIKANHLQHIVVPQKWLYRLPKRFSDSKTGKNSYVLIVEQLDICEGGKDPNGDLAKRYYNMDLSILKELCITVYYFRGLDSMLHNMPFTHQNQIAFIDTERWDWKREGYLKQAMPFLSKDRQEYALREFEGLTIQENR